MPFFDIRNFLIKLQWTDYPTKDQIKIVYRARGAPNDENTVTWNQITKVEKMGMDLMDETYIPFHRILRITNGEEILYVKQRF
ncbi:hypothetical protein NEF87_001595 [Candidatus Lokiarchaeum ossiferum]|uniref:MJ1316 RNA cyclic group end recognition domain-containing protein n=1 Tax=Candidatus Lokiarchaeum ossiferum TaxID=2951803 RepID=A0ABY6HP59_9ARCH|nr:hypothetical protein NEF87_001595 [Candidatus Lokiarchaeum sp. B-35]